jgi:HK97 family phage prohead protease
MEAADFGGWATKADMRCADGLTIAPEAFQHMHGERVPLIWAHQHDKADAVLGHAILEARDNGMYAYGFFNDTPQGKNAAAQVQHEDLNALSIYANQLDKRGNRVVHGQIREVSLVLAGANPGAKIDFVSMAHGYEDDESEAIIHSGLPLEFGDEDDDLQHDGGDQTVGDALDSLPEETQTLFYSLLGAILSDNKGNDSKSMAQGDNDPNNLTHKEGQNGVTYNVFDQNKSPKGGGSVNKLLTADEFKGIMTAAEKGGSFKHALEDYALAHGITNLDIMFPNAQALDGTPQWLKRRTEWVAGVLGSVSHTPFAKVKTRWADITQDEARALGYIKGTYKKEEWLSLSQRTTGPTTVYKKQKFDRDDLIDATELNTIPWIQGEMRLMLEEELARAILIGDGRDPADPDKIKDPMAITDGNGIRSILHENEMFASVVNVNVDDANSSLEEALDALVLAREYYKGTGTPAFYTTQRFISRCLLLRDTQGRRLYNTKADLAAYLDVSALIPVEVMAQQEPNLIGIMVNLADYNVGADKGGEVNLFDFFDIDYNQQKYLMETRISGALATLKSALIVMKTAATGVLATPTSPTFVKATGVVTIPTVTGVVYKDGNGTTLTAGAQTALAAGASMVVKATPASGYFFSTPSEGTTWTFKRPLS